VTRLYDDHADLYDLAFDWDVSEEVAWLHERLGGRCRSVLEPGCGSGRVLEALARRGLAVAGIDRSPAMVDAARRRLAAAGVEATIVRADMADFDLGRTFDGAVCPVGTLAHLSPEELVRHLRRMESHLERRARYLVQLPLYGVDSEPESRWDMTRGGTTLAITWTTEHVDLAAGTARQRSRIEIRTGPRAGEVVEEVHTMTAWTPDRWAAAVAGSPFTATAVYDGDRDGRPRVTPHATGGLLWHELVRRPAAG
jgi:SAM-dependent methyltransferase